MKNLKVAFYRHNRYGVAQPLAAHRIRYYDLTVLIDGHLEYLVDGKAISLSAGDVLFVRAGQERERLPSSAKQDYVSFNFYCDELSVPLLTHIPKGMGREIKLLLAACDAVETRTREDDNRSRGYVLCALLSLLQERTAVYYSPLTEAILRYLHAHLADRVTLAELGRAVHFSPVYCDTVFKRETGRSIVTYLLDERIEEAKRLLEERSIPLGDLCAAVGFCDYNYFSRCFKRRVGYTPTQYRRAMLAHH